MSISVGDNFSYLGAKPMDGRLKYDTLADMVGMADSTLYDGCMAYCVATDKNYQWKSTNETDATLGKWREVEGVAIATASTAGKVKPDDETIEVDSNGTISVVDMVGATASTAGTKGLIPSPSAGDNGKFLKGDGTWGELNTLGFTPVGTIISVMGTTAPQNYLACDGTAYNIADYPVLSAYITEQFGTVNYFGGDGTTTFAVPDLRGEFLRGTGTNSHENQGSGGNVGEHQDGTESPNYTTTNAETSVIIPIHDSGSDSTKPKIVNPDSQVVISDKFGNINFISTSNGTIVTRYTSRPTNTSVLYCIASTNIYIDARFDYSTTEKVVGTWIDGKPLYQKTITGTTFPNNNMIQVSHGISDFDEACGVEGMMHMTAGGYTPIPRVQDNNTNVLMAIDISASYIQLKGRSYDFAQTFDKWWVTIRYTKTTD